MLSKRMLMTRLEFKRTQNLHISTTLQCLAENVHQVSEDDIQMFAPLRI